MLPRLAEAAAGKRKVFFVDAAHFVLGSFLGMIWCISRVFIKTSPGRKCSNLLGAVVLGGGLGRRQAPTRPRPAESPACIRDRVESKPGSEARCSLRRVLFSRCFRAGEIAAGLSRGDSGSTIAVPLAPP
jgi:hypothetical protein